MDKAYAVAMQQQLAELEEEIGQIAQAIAMLKACMRTPQTRSELLVAADLANAYLNYKRHIVPLLEQGLIEMTIPEKPNSRLQKYRLTEAGRRYLNAQQS